MRSRSFPLQLVAVICLVVAMPFAAGCGLMFGGTRQTIRATSSPEGAVVVTTPSTVDYKTPTVLNLERKNSYVLTFSMPGYTSQKVEVQRKMRVGIVVLDVLSGLVGVVIDAATGAWYQLTPDVNSVTLTKTSADMPGPETITVTFSATATPNGNSVNVQSTAPGVLVVAKPN